MSILFRNYQWQVTGRGLEAANEIIGLRIPINQLLQLRDGESLYEWPLHMAEKTWVDFSAFEQAFRMAVHLHASMTQVDPVALDLSIQKGREVARRIQEFRLQKIPG